jgi:hypothetical protein
LLVLPGLPNQGSRTFNVDPIGQSIAAQKKKTPHYAGCVAGGLSL